MPDTIPSDADLGRSYLTCDALPGDQDPRIIAERVLNFEEHEHLVSGGAAIDWLMRLPEKVKGGRRVLGTCTIPKVQGELSGLFDDMLVRLLGRQPDFLVVLDFAWWADATPLQREVLVHHELCHAQQARDPFGAPRFDREGNAVWMIQEHDVTAFNSEVRRYGAHSPDLEVFLEAITEHMEAPRGASVSRGR